MNLYGNDMDESTHPLETGLGWTVAFEPADRNFIGRAALEAARAGGALRRSSACCSRIAACCAAPARAG